MDVEPADPAADGAAADSAAAAAASAPPTRVPRLAGSEMALVFSSSVDTTHRLCRLLQIVNGQALRDGSGSSSASGSGSGSGSGVGAEAEGLGAGKGKGGGGGGKGSLLFGGAVEEMSRNLRDDERAALLQRCAAGSVRVLVSSDQMARGMDLANVRLVVNYDAPRQAKTYVHRVGRTARANRDGFAVTMLKSGQVGDFRKMRGLIGFGQAGTAPGQVKKKVPKCRVDKGLEEALGGRVAAGIRRLPQSLGLDPSASAEIGE